MISLAGILFWGGVLRLREEIRANIVTVATSLVVGLYLVEGGLTFFGFGQPNYRAAAAKLGVEYDERTKLEVIEDLIAEGVDAVPTIGSARKNLVSIIGTYKEDTHHLFPLGGVANKTTVYGNESGKYLIYRSDRHGFNNPDTEWDAKEIEYLLLGDSFTHGACVNRPYDITSVLRKLSNKSAINLGISSSGSLTEFASLREYLPKNVRNIILLYYEGNDNSELLDELKNEILLNYSVFS